MIVAGPLIVAFGFCVIAAPLAADAQPTMPAHRIGWPVEQPTKFELVINLKTAKALGLTIPQPCWSGQIA